MRFRSISVVAAIALALVGGLLSGPALAQVYFNNAAGDFDFGNVPNWSSNPFLGNGGGNAFIGNGFTVTSTGTYTTNQELQVGTEANPYDALQGVPGGPGKLNVDAGVLTVNWNLVVGQGRDDVNDNSGVIDVASGATLNVNGGRALIGFFDNNNFGATSGSLNINGGTFQQNNGVLIVGGWDANNPNNYGRGFVNVGANSTVNLQSIQVGSWNGVGQITQSGGVVNATGYFTMGVGYDGASGTGTYNMQGGSLTVAGDFSVHEANSTPSSVSSFIQTGGVVTVNGGKFVIGRSSVGQGVYSISSGNLNVTQANLRVGGTDFNNNCNGELDVSGNALVMVSSLGTPQAGLVIGATQGSTGVVNQTGGVMLLLPATYGVRLGSGGTGASATYNLNGGVLTTPLITVDLGAAANSFNFGGGTLQANGSMTVNAAPNFTTTINSGGATFDTNGNNITWNSALMAGNGSGGLTKLGNGILMLTGSNSYTGATNVVAGTLEVTQTASLPGYNTNGVVTVQNASTLAVAAGGAGQWQAADIDALRSSATWNTGSYLGIDTSGGDFVYNSSIQQAIGLVKLGGNTLSLSGISNISGFIVNGGTATVTGITTAGNKVYVGSGTPWDPAYSAPNANGTLVIQSGASLTINGDLPDTFVVGRDTGATGTVIQNGGLLDFSPNVYHDLLIAAGNATGVYNMNGGTLNLHQNGLGIACYATPVSGTFNLSGGLVQANHVWSNTAQGTFNFSGGTLQATNDSVTFFQGLNAAKVNAGGAFIDSNGHNITIAQNLVSSASPDGGLTKLGPGMLTLRGINTYGGGTFVTSGTLAAATTASIGGAVTLSNNSTLALTGFAVGSQVNLVGQPVLASTAGDQNPAWYAVDGNTGTRWWSGDHSIPGWIYVDMGANYTLGQVGIAWERANGRDYTIRVATQSEFNASSDPTTWPVAASVANNQDWSGDGSVWTNTNLNAPSTGRYLAIDCTASNWTPDQTDLMISIWEIHAFQAASATYSITALSGEAGTTVALGLNNLSVGDSTNTTFGGTIIGSGGLTKTGSGTLVLTGANTYGGGTTVTDGALVLANSSAIADGTSLTVGADAVSIFGSATALGATAASQNAPAVTAVPEPGTLVLLAMGAVVGFGLWRRRSVQNLVLRAWN